MTIFRIFMIKYCKDDYFIMGECLVYQNNSPNDYFLDEKVFI